VFFADDLNHTSVPVPAVMNKNYLRQGEMLCFAVQTNEIRTCAMLWCLRDVLLGLNGRQNQNKKTSCGIINVVMVHYSVEILLYCW